MNPVRLIAQKRDGHELTRDEIAFLIRGFVDGDVPEYQMSALAMAVVGLYMAQSKIRKQFAPKTPIKKSSLDSEPFGKSVLYCQSPNLRWERPRLGRVKNLWLGT